MIIPKEYGGLGFSATLLSIILALLPPADSEHPGTFLLKVGGGCVAFIAVGLYFFHRNRTR
jgi:alkylation response protein AidB-like acyl-CoA dehydrogenase